MNFPQFNQRSAELQAIATSKTLTAGQLLFTRQEPAGGGFILEAGHIQLLNYKCFQPKQVECRTQTCRLKLR